MSDENIQLEQYEGTAASSQLKQLSWQINPSNPELSTGTYKSQAGIEVVLLDAVLIQQLISSGVASVNSSPFVIVSSWAEFALAMSDPAVLNIWVNSLIQADGVAIDVLSSKNIYGNRNSILISPASQIQTFSYPDSDPGFDIEVKLYTNILGGTTESVYFLSVDGGYTGNTNNFAMYVIEFDGNLEPLQGFENNEGFIYYELNNGTRNSYGFTQNVENELWSGIHTQLKNRIDNTISPTAKLQIGGNDYPWDNDIKVTDVGKLMSIFSFDNVTIGSGSANNAYFGSSSWRFKETGIIATRIHQSYDGSTQILKSSATGTAGNPITWAPQCKVDSTGKVFLYNIPNGDNQVDAGASANEIWSDDGYYLHIGV